MNIQNLKKENLNKRNYANSLSGNHCGTFDIGGNYHSTSTK